MALGQSAESKKRPTAESSAPAVAWDAVKQFFTFAAGHRLWTACMLVFILTWTIELYVVQEATLVFSNVTGPRYAMWAPKIRFVLDLFFISMLSITLRRRWLIAVIIGSFCVYLGLLTYYSYFLRPLSLLTILAQWQEALKVGALGVELFPAVPAMLLLAALAVQLALLALAGKESLPRQSRWVMGAALLAGYVAVSGMTVYLDPLDAILTTRGVGRLGYIRGYLGPWFAEWYYLRDDELLERAIARRKLDYNRITPLEADIPIRRKLVIMQAESLDTNILGYQADGVEVTPFLNRLRDVSMFYRVEAVHANGSSDADFCVLNGVPGSANENTYSLPGYPYENTTPQILAECGFESYSFHGNSGEFYGRRVPYEKMGFTGVRFSEDLVADYDLKLDRWGVRDEDVLRVAAREMRGATKPTCHFIITLTTHTPYTLLHPSEMEIYPQPNSRAQHYINNMRYLDNRLRDYITSLGGDTTVMIYADHPTEGFDGFVPDRELNPNREFIPCFIYDANEDLSRAQKTRHDPRATDGTWNLVDVANYLRAQIKRSHGPPPAEAADGSQTQPDNTEEPEHARKAAR